MGPRYQNTTLPHPTEQQPTDISKPEPNSPKNRITQAHNIISKNGDHNKNHTRLQHPQQYINCQMQPTKQQDKDRLTERRINADLQDIGRRRDHPPPHHHKRSYGITDPQIRGKTRSKPHEESNRTAQRSQASLTLPHRHWGRREPHRL